MKQFAFPAALLAILIALAAALWFATYQDTEDRWNEDVTHYIKAEAQTKYACAHYGCVLHNHDEHDAGNRFVEVEFSKDAEEKAFKDMTDAMADEMYWRFKKDSDERWLWTLSFGRWTR